MKWAGWVVAFGVALGWLLGPWGPSTKVPPHDCPNSETPGFEAGAPSLPARVEDNDTRAHPAMRIVEERTIPDRAACRVRVKYSSGAHEDPWAGTATVFGSVRSEEGVALNRARVEVTAEPNAWVRATIATNSTSDDARYGLVVPPGSYLVEAEIPIRDRDAQDVHSVELRADEN